MILKFSINHTKNCMVMTENSIVSANSPTKPRQFFEVLFMKRKDIPVITAKSQKIIVLQMKRSMPVLWAIRLFQYLRVASLRNTINMNTSPFSLTLFVLQSLRFMANGLMNGKPLSISLEYQKKYFEL